MKITLYILIISLMVSCNLDGTNFSSGTGNVDLINVEIPDTVPVSTNAVIKATALEYNGCWSSLYTQFTKLGNFEYELKALGTYASNGACPAVLVSVDTLITFKPEQSGTYLFRIVRKPYRIITDTMVVE